jgi:hypothetical protein
MVNKAKSLIRQKVPFIAADFPEKCRTLFAKHFDNIPTAGALKNGVYRINNDSAIILKGNDIFDPEAGHGSNPVRNHSLWSSLYTKYNVTACRITGRLRPNGTGLRSTGTDTGSAFLFVIIPRLDTIPMYTSSPDPTATEYRTIRNHPLATVYRFNYDADRPSRQLKIDVSAKTYDVLEYYDAEQSSDHPLYLSHLNTSIGNSPTAAVNWYWHIYLLADSPSFTNTSTRAIECDLDLHFYTELLGQKTVG